MSTKLILTHDVTNLGVAGDVVTVKDGYARNYLVPRNLATPWTKWLRLAAATPLSPWKPPRALAPG